MRWTSTSAVYDSASISADQSNTAAGGGSVSFGVPPEEGDAPLPAWAYALLGVGLFTFGVLRELRGLDWMGNTEPAYAKCICVQTHKDRPPARI